MTHDKLSITLKTNSRASRSSLAKFWDFQFREVPDSRKGFERLAEQISEELSFCNQIKGFLFKNRLFFIAGVKLKFRFERLRNKLRSSTFDNCEITAWSSEICIISSDDREDLFADELLVYKEWKARYEVEE